MPRKAKSIAERWKELTGEDYLQAYDGATGKRTRWCWLNYPVMTFADVLSFTGLPKGRIESYLRRNLWELSSQMTGSGNHQLYTPRDVLKLIAIDRLAEAGAWPECIRAAFEVNRQFDLILNGYLHRDYDHDSLYDPERVLNFNDDVWRSFRETGKFPKGIVESWVDMTFDVRLFLRDMMPKLIQFFAETGVKVDN